jgi:hypothetical protein
VPRLPGAGLPAGRSGPQPLRQLGSTPTVQVVILSFSVEGQTAPASPLAEVDVEPEVPVVVPVALVEPDEPPPLDDGLDVVELPPPPEDDDPPAVVGEVELVLESVVDGGLLLLQPANAALATTNVPRPIRTYERILIAVSSTDARRGAAPAR